MIQAQAIAPVVMDLLNIHVSLKHSFMSMGNWTFAFEDFDREDIMAQFRVSTENIGRGYISQLSHQINYQPNSFSGQFFCFDQSYSLKGLLSA